MNTTMRDNEEESLLVFLRKEALQGHLESTTNEIADGINLGYNLVARILERLIVKDNVGCREKGTERKSVRYYYLRDIIELCRSKWGAENKKIKE